MTTPEKPSIPPMSSAPPKTVEAVRVHKLIFPAERVVPLRDCDGTIGHITAGKGRRHSGVTVEIQYEPWIRHHRVREIENGKVTIEILVSEQGVIAVLEPPAA